MITEKLIAILLEPAMASIALLEKIEAKIDAQVFAKLRGALRSLQVYNEQQEGVSFTVRMALTSFTECSEYFRSLIAWLDGQINFDRKIEGKSSIRQMTVLGKYAAGTLRDLIGLGQGQLNKELLLEIERINCINLLIISELGRIACMSNLAYHKINILEDLERLRTTKFNIQFDAFLPRVVDQDLLSPSIKSMNTYEFEACYGSILHWDDVQRCSSQRDHYKARLMRLYGRTLSEIQKYDFSYDNICAKAGRRPKSFEEFVDMSMAYWTDINNEKRSIIDRIKCDGLFGIFEKLVGEEKIDVFVDRKLAYWADKNSLQAWAEAFFQYALIITLIQKNTTPRQLFTAIESCGFWKPK